MVFIKNASDFILQGEMRARYRMDTHGMPIFRVKKGRRGKEIVFWRFKGNQERKFSLKTREERAVRS